MLHHAEPKNRFPMNYRFVAFLLSIGFGYTSALTAQQIHACVVIAGGYAQEHAYAHGSEPAAYSPRLPQGVQKAVALGRPNTSAYNSNFWPAGSILRVKFLGGSGSDHQRVMRYADEWTRYANVNFTVVSAGTSDIRISFVQNGSSWSMLGRQSRSAPESRATMNFGWLNDRTSDQEFRRTVLHEFGHALGLLHEHQNPTGGIPWNEEEVYAFYYRTQGWDRSTTYHNVIARQDHDETQYSAYDPRSIMHYPVDPRLTTGGYTVGLNTSISRTDAAFIARMYPGRTASTSTTTAPARTGTSTPTATGPTAPNRPTVVRRPTRTETTDRPAPTGTHRVTISNRLGKGQNAQVVELSLNGRQHRFELRAGHRSRQAIRLQLKPGMYPYRVETASVYSVMGRVREGDRFVERRQNRTVHGSGQGQLHVAQDGNLSFYEKYDKERGRMKVYLREE